MFHVKRPTGNNYVMATTTALTFVFALAAGWPAMAATVVNQDDAEYELVVINGDTEKVVAIAAKSVVNDICESCIIELSEGVAVEVGSDTQTITIQGGKFLPSE